MFRLVHADLAAARKGQGSELSPTLFAHVQDRHVPRFEISHGGGKVVAHEEKLVLVVLLGMMEGGLKWRHGENQPAVAGINAWKLEHISKKRPVGFGILGIDNDMCSIDQAGTLVAERGGMFSLRRYIRNPTLRWELAIAAEKSP